MAVKKSELYSSLWASCDELRGGMDASEYKDYVLLMLFIKYVSDKYAGVAYAPITVPEGSSFNNKYTLNQRICSLKSHDCSSKFLYWVLNRNKYFLAFDSGTGQTNLKRQQVLDCLFPLPPTKAEQTAIAEILSNMDSEIQALETKLSKQKLLKQAMMQELLTGKTRLI